MTRLYSSFVFLGLMAVPASFLIGWRFDPGAPVGNYVFNFLAFMLFMAIHIIMLLPAFKKLVYGNPDSSSNERRIYVIISVVTWLALYIIHKPVPGFGFESPVWLQFFGVCLFLLGFLMFFEGIHFEFLNAFLGTPGTELSHSSDGSTPLLTEGSYGKVRHPMYRGAVTYALSSLLIHPHTGQLLFSVMVALGFLLFIPFEEKALVKARGDEYTAYMEVVKYRVFRGIW